MLASFVPFLPSSVSPSITWNWQKLIPSFKISALPSSYSNGACGRTTRSREMEARLAPSSCLHLNSHCQPSNSPGCYHHLGRLACEFSSAHDMSSCAAVHSLTGHRSSLSPLTAMPFRHSGPAPPSSSPPPSGSPTSSPFPIYGVVGHCSSSPSLCSLSAPSSALPPKTSPPCSSAARYKALAVEGF